MAWPVGMPLTISCFWVMKVLNDISTISVIVTIRTLDPPLHEFLPRRDNLIRDVAELAGEIHVLEVQGRERRPAGVMMLPIPRARRLAYVRGAYAGAAVAGTAIFGRFLCSWGCHILALQDFSAWLLDKLRIKPRAIRSRLLLWVPMGAALYMFMWPPVAMWRSCGPSK